MGGRDGWVIIKFSKLVKDMKSHIQESQGIPNRIIINPQGSGQAISASPSHDSHTEARHMLPHCRCVTASGSPLVWGTGMD